MLRADAFAEILTGIFNAKPITDTAARRATWEKCWADNAQPPYFGKKKVCRVGDGFVDDPDLERTKFCELRADVFDEHLKGITEVSEFGCGTGENLKAIRGRRTLRAFDWSKSAVKRCRALAMMAREFDMFHPDYNVKLQGAALTVHAMEQLGHNWKPFFKFLFAQKVKCIHIEPIVELYDDMNLADYLQLSFHRKRGYLEGFLPYLQLLAQDKKIELLEVSRSPFGGLYHSAYSVVVWRPI